MYVHVVISRTTISDLHPETEVVSRGICVPYLGKFVTSGSGMHEPA